MKTLARITIIMSLIFRIGDINAQTCNWASLQDDHKHVGTINLGWEYGAIFGLGYGYKFAIKSLPAMATIEYSFPSGTRINDDFKTKLGGHIRWLNLHGIQFTTRVHGVFRRFENDFVGTVNFGSDLAGILGYYRPKWFISGEVGFDKAIVTRFKHSNSYKEINPTVVNGWFIPSTGGNFYYGLQTGISIKRSEINLRIGRILTQDFRTKPTIPYYTQLGYNRKF